MRGDSMDITADSELFAKIKQAYNGAPIAHDGIVCPKQYENIVFFLKEVNKPNMAKNWPYYKVLYFQANPEEAPINLRKDFYRSTFTNICLWIEAFFNPTCSYEDCFLADKTDYDIERLRKNLNKTAIVNIKKTAGGGSSKYEELIAVCHDPKKSELLKTQLKHTEPALVICGGTFELAKIIFNIQDTNIQFLPSGAKYFLNDNVVFLEFTHPAWFSVPQKILFAYAQSVFNDVKNIINLRRS